jgi:hypothetical protein
MSPPVARPQNVDADQHRHGRIEHEPAGHRHERDADNHTARRDHVGHHMPSVRDERRRLPAAAPGQQEPCPDSVDETCSGIDRETNNRSFKRLGRKKAKIGGAEDRKSRHYDQHSFEDRRKVFCLMVAVRVIGVSRSLRDAQGNEGRAGGHDVDRAFQRIRIERDRPRQPVSGKLQPKHDEAYADATECGLLRAFHR